MTQAPEVPGLEGVRRLIETSVDLFCVAVDGYFTWVSPGWAVLGWTPEELTARPFLEWLHPADVEATREQVARLDRGEQVVEFENRYRRKDGGYCWLMWNAVPAEDRSVVYGWARDVTVDRKERRRQAEKTRLLLMAEEMAHVGHWRLDLVEHTMTWSDEVFRIHGLPVGGGPPPYDSAIDFYHPEDRDQVRALVERAIAEQKPYTIAGLRFRRADGEERIVESKGNPELDRDGNVVAVFGIMRDVTHAWRAAKILEQQAARLRQQTDRLRSLASFDQLTGLPNRHQFGEHLEQALDRVRLKEGRLGLLYLDLDGFKDINDTLGHSAGDTLLSMAAQRLLACVREVDMVARMGGDEFTVILEGVQDAERAKCVARRILEGLTEPFPLQGRLVHVAASIGITVYPEDATSSEDLLRNADTAMYRAKELGRNRLKVYEPEMTQRLSRKRSLLRELRAALEDGSFTLHYQPRIAASGVVGFEALLRWRRVGELVPPSRFIPLLEKSGLIVPVGRWVLDAACEQLRAWRAVHPTLTMAVNLSPEQFRDKELVADIAGSIERAGVPASALELEITEGVLVEDMDTASKTLQTLKERGLRVAIDDFGTGYSSLAYLKNLPVDVIKIDRAFVTTRPGTTARSPRPSWCSGTTSGCGSSPKESRPRASSRSCGASAATATRATCSRAPRRRSSARTGCAIRAASRFLRAESESRAGQSST